MLFVGSRKTGSKVFSKKFSEFRVVFAVLSLVLLSGAFVGAVIWSGVTLTSFGETVTDALTQRLSKDESASFFIRAFGVFRPAAVFLLISFFFGVTVYSPVVCFLLCLLFGICGGMTIGLCSRLTPSGIFSAVFAAETLFFLLCGLVLCVCSSFCTCVSFKQNRFIPEGEERLFGGSLFCGDFFGNVNLRFCFMYIAVFFIFSLLLFLFSCLRVLAALYI